jgi:hypothetical protein
LALLLIQEWLAAPDDQTEEWWDEFEQEMIDSRLAWRMDT